VEELLLDVGRPGKLLLDRSEAPKAAKVVTALEGLAGPLSNLKAAAAVELLVGSCFPTALLPPTGRTPNANGLGASAMGLALLKENRGVVDVCTAVFDALPSS